MTAGGYGYGYVRATDADRERVRTVLADAHATGRLSWSDFDARTNALMNAQTYDQLAALTADLPGGQPTGPAPGAYQGPSYAPAAQGYGGGYQVTGYAPTNPLSIASLVCGLAQFLGFWVVTGIPAIIMGHIARRQIRERGEQGDGMALAGMILGYIGLVLGIIFTIFIIVAVVAVSHDHNINTQFPQQ
jgi:uncharacterized protein DUF4190/uncharacterized protein DUF1707